MQYWLNKKGITQTELSKRIGWKQRMISKWCNNEAPMSVEAMYTVSIALDIDMKYLYTWEPLK